MSGTSMCHLWRNSPWALAAEAPFELRLGFLEIRGFEDRGLAECFVQVPSCGARIDCSDTEKAPTQLNF